MMKRFAILLVILSLFGCAQKNLNSGNYDAAIRKSVRKLKKKPNSQKHINILTTAWNKANGHNNDRIKFLKTEGRPSHWDEIYSLYMNLKRRQTLVKTLPSAPKGISFSDYDGYIIQAKEKAAEYHYEYGNRLLKKGNREDARRAYNEFTKVKRYYEVYRDLNDMISRAEFAGASNVLFKMQNATPAQLPKQFEQELTKISLYELNRKWLKYHTQEVEGHEYDYTILVNMKVIDVSPQNVKEKHYEESKKIRDGWEYELDENGNVKKDSLGNDIKKPKFRTLTCKVIESQQTKAATIRGSLDFLNNRNGQLLKTAPIAADAFFEHISAKPLGDLRALSPETHQKTKNHPVPFPADGALILQAGTTLKKMVKGIIWENKGLLK
ncbi:MAG: hypothetical protein COA57_09970 [Flavobacteriales bacterium]|nr:hypothetical protein [Bacteroidales bacterium AH-315-I05]PCJ84048.1 MAG: hypothetical protein COA57_09970 [Flavobacteriales bacterium]